MSSIAFTVFKKELRDIFRDKKTLLVSVLIPLILFPIMFYAMGKTGADNVKKVENNFKVAINGGERTQFRRIIENYPKLKITPSSNIEEDVKNGNILIGIEIPDNVDALLEEEKGTSVKIIFDNTSQQSSMAQGMIEKTIEDYNKQVVSHRLQKRNIDISILNPVNVEYQTSTTDKDSMGKIMLSMLLPLFLVIYSITGPMGAAVDLGAGEKERGTLEPLLTTQAGRMSLLWGKFFAIAVVGLMTTGASMLGLLISLTKFGETLGTEGGAISLNLGASTFALIFLMIILLNMTFGALELSISIYARSFKEAQTYLAPLNIIALVPVYTTYMLDARNIDTFYFHIPVANTVCLLKEFLAGVFNTSHILMTFGWILVYIMAAIFFARYMFSKEEVIFRT
ncbi:sodium transport system permease protein [Clostridium pascui]|uniref:ABC transporter permease n=1 Tax=Clostridium pascui TaxID=46609 RepID=UPI00195666CA|nr:ABC transporter permease [Clostridium pascui]MBM7871041.1 sodium transport system permease protein [Clostridium pascui]